MVVGIIANERKERAAESVARLLADLDRSENRAVMLAAPPDIEQLDLPVQRVDAAALIEQSDVVVAFGGDGTMLGAGRMLAGSSIPLIGVNLGRLGFLAEFSPDEVGAIIDEIAEGRARIVERRLIRAVGESLPDDGLIALNDIVVDKRGSSLLVNLDVTVNGDFLGTYTADGLIVSTPTGSTGYALAVGGPVIAPNAGVLLLAPIAPHMLTARPVVLSDSADIVVRPQSGSQEPELVHVIADGQTEATIPAGSSLSIGLHDRTVHLVKRATRTYFDVLRAKLLWGRRPSFDRENGDSGL